MKPNHKKIKSLQTDRQTACVHVCIRDIANKTLVSTHRCLHIYISLDIVTYIHVYVRLGKVYKSCVHTCRSVSVLKQSGLAASYYISYYLLGLTLNQTARAGSVARQMFSGFVGSLDERLFLCMTGGYR